MELKFENKEIVEIKCTVDEFKELMKKRASSQ